jgi:hypothetical protein
MSLFFLVTRLQLTEPIVPVQQQRPALHKTFPPLAVSRLASL